MLQYLQQRERNHQSKQIIIPSIYSLKQLDTEEYIKQGGVLLGFDVTGTKLLGYTCLSMPSTTNNQLLEYHYSLIYSHFFPPNSLHFHSLPILPMLNKTPSLSLHIIPSEDYYIIYHHSSNTLYFTLLTPSQHSFPCHFIIQSIPPPFSFIQRNNCLIVTSSSHVVTIQLNSKNTLLFDESITGRDNIVTIDLNTIEGLIKINGLLFNESPIHTIIHRKVLPQHVILPFSMKNGVYHTLHLDENVVEEYIFYGLFSFISMILICFQN